MSELEEAIDMVRDVTERAEAMGLGLAKYTVEDVRTILDAMDRLGRPRVRVAPSLGGDA